MTLRERSLGAWLERAGVIVLLLAALAMRSRQLAAGFDRELDGSQGAVVAIAAVNYERLGLTRFHGYPARIVDLPVGAENEAIEPADALVYAEHPPLVPLLGWAALQAMGPRGWNEAWREGRAPERIELALRLPFLALHLLGLWLFHRLLRASLGRGTALIGLAIFAVLPVTILYGSLVGHENPALPCVLGALLAYVRCFRGDARGLAFLGLAFLLGAAGAWTTACFLPPIVLHALVRSRWRLALLVGAIGSLGIALPSFAHAWLAPAGMGSGGMLEQVRGLLHSFGSGEHPIGEWLASQRGALVDAMGGPVVVVAVAGLVVQIVRALVPRVRATLAPLEVAPASARIDVASILALGAGLCILASSPHTLEAQWPLELLVAPAVAACAASLLACLGRPLLRLRAGLAPHVLLVGSLLLPGLAHLSELERELRAPGPSDDPLRTEGPELALPRKLGATIAPLVPRGALALVPQALGTTPALAFYAWRNILPTANANGTVPPPISGSRFLAGAPCVLLLPDAPPAGARGQVDALRAALAGAPSVSGEGWTRYALR